MVYPNAYVIHKSNPRAGEKIFLSSSKSESNRSLILQALAGGKSTLKNLSDARDTRIMENLLNSGETNLNVMDAGTTMRFLTAFFAVTNQHKILAGTARMNQRPIKLLVEALRTIGAEIKYLDQPGYPPLEIRGFSGQKTNQIKIPGDISSQYISALLMIAPVLPNGLRLEITGKINSLPYIEMTLQLMKKFGAKFTRYKESLIEVHSSPYEAVEYVIESDWSGASYWFGLAALLDNYEIYLQGLKEDSLQGDKSIMDIMRPLGVEATFKDELLHLKNIPAEPSITYDFSGCPDLVQTAAVVCAAKGIEANFSGVESLHIKETDRIAALKNELNKFGVILKETKPGTIKLNAKEFKKGNKTKLETYDDHRMAMAFAPLGAISSVIIHNPGVVEKSYPTFWDEFSRIGMNLEPLDSQSYLKM